MPPFFIQVTQASDGTLECAPDSSLVNEDSMVVSVKSAETAYIERLDCLQKVSGFPLAEGVKSNGHRVHFMMDSLCFSE